jgi:DUF4097 and DUF4098 domain-containing protein YvlB
MKITTVLIVFGVIWLIIACSGDSGEVTVRASGQGDLKKTFSVQPGGRLVMDVEPGAIDVKTTNDHQIVVEVFRRIERVSGSRAEEMLRQHEVTFDHQDNNLVVRARVRDDGFKLWRRSGLSVRYMVSIPHQFNVDLKTSGGGISVGDLRGELRARTSGGSLHLGKIDGPVFGNTSGGSISLAACSGRAEIKTSGGSIHFGSGGGEMTAETSGGSIKIENFNGNVLARTGGGNITAERIEGSIDASTSGGPINVVLTGQPERDSRLHSSGGGITVELEEDVALNIEAEASGGSVASELPVTVQGSIRKDALKGTLNGGGRALVLQASGGSIQLRKLRRQ